MRRRWAWTAGVVLGIGLLWMSRPARAVITRLTPLAEVLAEEKLIFLAKVDTLDPAKPGMVLTVAEEFKGKPPFRKLPVNLTGDSESKKEKHAAQLLKRLAPGLPVIVFASPDERVKRYLAFGYTNGTWFQMIGHVDKADPAVVRWTFTHCEPYLRRTFKDDTAALRQVIRDGLDGKKSPPEPNNKEKPGLGPEIPTAPSREEKRSEGSSPKPLVAVIPTFALLGPLALLAALFPAVFGGLMLVLKRWMVLLSVASLNSTLYFLHAWFQGSIQNFWWGKPIGIWFIMALVTMAGAFWSWRRYRTASSEERAAALQPRRGEKVLLGLASLTGVGVVSICALQGVLQQSPWKELLVIWTVAWIGTLYIMVLGFATYRQRALPAEGIMLWALVFACAGLGATMLPRHQNGVRAAWTFEPENRGRFISSPLVDGERLYVAAAHSRGLTRIYGTLYCLDRVTSRPLWTFDDDGDMKQVSISSPCVAEGRLYIGEGFHQDSDCKLYCLQAETGEKLWDFQTKSHTESSPIVAGGKVYFGAGEDGVFCLDARTGKELWHFENVHVDTTPAVVGNRLYAGSGYGDAYETFCLDADTGKPLWRTRVDLPVWGSPTVVGEDVLVGLGNGDFLQSADQPAGALLCLRVENGDVRWRLNVPDAVLMKPAVDETQVFFASRDGHCYAVDRQDGELRWKHDLGSPVVCAPALANAQLFVVASGGRVCCLRVQTGEVQWSFEVGQHSHKTPQLFSSPVVADGRVYFGAGLDYLNLTTPALYCLEANP